MQNKMKLLSQAAALSLATAMLAAPAHAQLADEIIVTATKRSASSQDIPVAVAALGEDTLDELGVDVFTDYLVQLPGVTAGGSGPGQSTIYIRGVASTTPTLSVSGVAGLAPNVALYLDEQPLSQPGRNLDVYAADLERVEVLSGPQGTLFGASSQAGTVRLITNKPKIGVQEAKFKTGASFTKSGDISYNAEAVYNAPIGENTALRAVVYYDHAGGYIDNVAGTATAADSARFRSASYVRDNGVVVGADRAGFQAGADLTGVTFTVGDNAELVEENFNPADYFGFRLSALHEFNDDWSAQVGYAHQELDADGVFFVDPSLGDLEVSRFTPETLEDDFDNLNWTVKGRLGSLDAVYTGAYTKRSADQLSDYTEYQLVGQYHPYYICEFGVTYPGTGVAPSGLCQSPESGIDVTNTTKVETHELRFNTDASKRFRATVGGFYSDLSLREIVNFNYFGSSLVNYGGVIGFSPDNLPAQGSSAVTVNQPYAPGTIFRNDILRTDKQVGLFGEATFDISDAFALTVGARYYDVKVDLKGSAAGSFGNAGVASGDNNAGNNLDTLFDGTTNPDKAVADGMIKKATLTYTPNDDFLFYGTYSEGFRPGLLNRPGGSTLNDATTGAVLYTVPYVVDTDEVNNFEFGWKTTLADNQIRFNGSAFFVDISNLQTTIFDPNIANLFFSDNAADAEVKGIEGDLTWAPASMSGLTVSGAFSLLDTEITRVITPTDQVVVGQELAYAPGFQGNLRARYEWDMGDNVAHIMPQLVYSASSKADVVAINTIDVDSWMTLGLSAGLTSDSWSAEIYAENLTDERAVLSNYFGNDRERQTVNRPLTVGMRFGYTFD